ncbi:LuxR family two component transcriptional regulator [Sulfuricella denitrificans skB26]|uniref:LuxR family two component transcriptional regulator n=1 Tax=Sulfuricella denitrificans (strain DSM 22764 / NBRC 105220 / skB26) TaxID=1163617 RepID=S6AJQ8_SULDS|nr:response regulator transcription factor [Sulfuricella denitrificans]BAN34774.1 LuxR family two component transcriptional regulator [Sulfuricella denitrificans skB26]
MSNKPATPTSIKVMLVDDHPVVRDGYRHLLENTPDIRVVAEANDGEEACALYEQHMPNVVILDLSMPGIGGLETLRRIKAKDPVMHILIFSMHDSQTLVLRSLEAGATGYLTKQGGVTQMVEAVRQVAQGKLFVDSKYVPDLMHHRLFATEDPLHVLSTREFQIFQLLAEGHSVSDIAVMLSISPKTVGVHHAHIMRKLRLQNAAQLVRLAIRCNIVKP